MQKQRALEIIEEEIKLHNINKKLKVLEEEAEADSQIKQKADILNAIADLLKAIQKFESSMTISMGNSFTSVLENLKQMLNDVGTNPDSYIDKIKSEPRRVVLKKSNDVVESVEKLPKTLKEHFELEASK